MTLRDSLLRFLYKHPALSRRLYNLGISIDNLSGQDLRTILQESLHYLRWEKGVEHTLDLSSPNWRARLAALEDQK